MMKKLMQNSKAAAAANNIHTHPPKGGGVIFAACSTREDGGQTTETHVRESRNVKIARVDIDVADGGSHPVARMPRISPQTPLTRVEARGEGHGSERREIITSRARLAVCSHWGEKA